MATNLTSSGDWTVGVACVVSAGVSVLYTIFSWTAWNHKHNN